MALDKELADFLAGGERRAFKQTVYTVRDDDAALNIVQDAMIKLAEKYGDRPQPELPLLFQRILQNATHDYFRRQKVRNTWVSLFSSFGNADDKFDSLETFESQDGTVGAESSESWLEREQVLNLIDAEIQKLPARQREAFLMRYWEDMDVAEIAAAMGCSEGSVKTHCSRATRASTRAGGERNHAMSNALDHKETEFALKVRRALDENINSLPAASLDKLAAARRMATARKKLEKVAGAAPVFAPSLAGAGAAGSLGAGGSGHAGKRGRFSRLALAWLLLALVIGLAGIAYWENQQRTAELADIDAAMLSDNLPLDAYLDHGFNAYLTRNH
ncbi:DNA-directed RNA polymerase specialized sigma subunit, sigma24-like protein [Candidatus Burkholderia crenata]|nr:DNA-directed RNA polymerase specialized sigma subunit, sigma24-like protein [Candidatus Burkholderia crenata]